MENNIVVSICMITYGHEKFIEQAINGVLMQETNFEVELIIANDCSPDATDSVIQTILKTHPRASIIKYINHSHNIGMMPNFVSGIKECTGNYIALCEADDYWTDPLKLQKQVDFLEANPEFSCCFHKVQIEYPDGRITDDFIKSRPSSYDDLETLMRFPNTIITPSVVFRNHLIDFPEEFVQSPLGDIFLFYLLAEKGKLKFLDEAMCVYRFGVGVYSANSEYQKHFKAIKFLVLFYSYYIKKNTSNRIPIIVSQKIFDFYKTFASEINAADFDFIYPQKALVKQLIDNYNSERVILEQKNIESKTWFELVKILFVRIRNKF